MDTGTIKQFYDDFTAKQVSMGVNERHHLIRDLALANGLKANMRVLEMGCGIGTLTGLLARCLPQGHLLAVDLSPASIERAKTDLKHHRNIELRVADVVQDDLDGPFDMIVLPDVLEHIPLPLHPTLFGRLRVLLAPNGQILIHSPDPYYSEWLRANKAAAQQVVDEALHLPCLTTDIHEAGLCVVRFQRHSIWTTTPDYMALVLTHPPIGATYSARPVKERSLFQQVKDLLARLLRR